MRRAFPLLAAAMLAAPAAAPAQDKPAGMTVTPYGFFLLDAFVNAGTFQNKDNANQVRVPTVSDSGGSFLMSARGSRLGFRVSGLDAGWLGAALSGVVEFDFKAGSTGTNSTAWNSAPMRLRLANAKADWKTPYGSWQVLAGQDYGLLLNVNPTSVTYALDPVFVNSGNLYRRSPQVRLTWSETMGDIGLVVAAGVFSPADADTQGTNAIDYGVGIKSRTPDVEARAGVSFKSGDVFKGTLGVGYHLGKRRYFTTDAGVGGHKDITASLLGIDADFSITPYLQLKGEYYTSKGAEDGHNGAFPGVFPSNPAVTVASTAALDAVTSDGYWAEMVVKPIPAVWLAVGYGAAKASKSKIANGARYENSQVHGALIFNAGKHLRFSVEAAQTESKYLNATSEKAEQYSFATQVPF